MSEGLDSHVSGVSVREWQILSAADMHDMLRLTLTWALVLQWPMSAATPGSERRGSGCLLIQDLCSSATRAG